MGVQKQDLTPPELTAKDGAHTAVKSVLGAIPVAGSAAIETFCLFVQPPLLKRQQQWMSDVGEAIHELQNKGISIKDLQNNDEFIDIVLMANQSAMRTSQKEKLEALRNAVLNSALENSPDISQQQMFLNYIDSFTVWHVKFLCFFQNPSDWLEKNNINFNSDSILGGGLGRIVETAFPDLIGQESFYKQIGKDLTSKDLADLEVFNVTMSGSGMLAKRTKPIGDIFIDFIT